MSWNDAKAFCDWAGLSLPSEAMWEKAARGTDGRKYAFGAEFPKDGTRVANVADKTAKRAHSDWTIVEGYDDGFVETAPVGSFPAGVSSYGAHDLTGNVWEWCADWYDSNAYARYAKGQTTPPTSGSNRVLRGGSWYDDAGHVRAAYRDRSAPSNRSTTSGSAPPG